MFSLIFGGAASGKSEYAENLALSLGSPRIYLATMESQGAENQRRIQRHRQLRAGKGFDTMECATGLDQLHLPGRGVVLLECLSNLLANEMFSPNGAGEDSAQRILDGVENLLVQSDHLVVVSNDIFADGVCYDPATRQYQQQLARLNQELAAQAQQVIEIVYTIPIFHKGGAGK